MLVEFSLQGWRREGVMGGTLALKKAGEGIKWGLLPRKLLARSSAQRAVGKGEGMNVLGGERGRYKVVWVWGN